jgi:hypothetical protein
MIGYIPSQEYLNLVLVVFAQDGLAIALTMLLLAALPGNLHPQISIFQTSTSIDKPILVVPSVAAAIQLKPYNLPEQNFAAIATSITTWLLEITISSLDGSMKKSVLRKVGSERLYHSLPIRKQG